MKKLLAIFLAIMTFLSLAVLTGCEDEQKETQPQATQPKETEPEETIPEGNEVGMRCFGMDLEVVDENGATGETVNPAKTGKVTVINFWGVWCGPCKSELPHFDELAENYDVSVIAVHSKEEKKKMAAYIQENFPDSKITFAWDITGENKYNDDYYILMGDVGAYPYTVVLDANGIITKTFIGMVSYEQLTEAVQEAGI